MRSMRITGRKILDSRIQNIVKYLDRVNVLHSFKKKTQATAKKDINLAKQRLKLLLEEIKNGE